MGEVATWYVGGCMLLFAVGWCAGVMHKTIIQMAEAL